MFWCLLSASGQDVRCVSYRQARGGLADWAEKRGHHSKLLLHTKNADEENLAQVICRPLGVYLVAGAYLSKFPVQRKTLFKTWTTRPFLHSTMEPCRVTASGEQAARIFDHPWCPRYRIWVR